GLDARKLLVFDEVVGEELVDDTQIAGADAFVEALQHALGIVGHGRVLSGRGAVPEPIVVPPAGRKQAVCPPPIPDSPIVMNRRFRRMLQFGKGWPARRSKGE